jgi:capsular polysaccharide biosynthesis protein
VEPYRERIEDFIRRWRSRYEGDRVFRVLVITVVLAAVGVTSSGLQQTPTYEASAHASVAQKQGTPGQLQQTSILEMMHAIDSRPIAEEAIGRLGLQMGAAELLDNLTVEQIEDTSYTSFIVLTYEDTDPYKAKRIVNTVSEVSSELISERNSAFRATVWEKAAVPETPVSPHPLRNGLLTLVIGLVMCAGTLVALPAVGARVAGTLGERPTRQGVGLAGVLRRQRRDRSIVERIKEKKLLQALGRCGKLTAVEAALETSLSVEEANRMLQDLAAKGQLQVDIEDGRLVFSFWEREA